VVKEERSTDGNQNRQKTSLSKHTKHGQEKKGAGETWGAANHCMSLCQLIWEKKQKGQGAKPAPLQNKQRKKKTSREGPETRSKKSGRHPKTGKATSEHFQNRRSQEEERAGNSFNHSKKRSKNNYDLK